MDALEQVRTILQKCPEAANEPFWDHDCEPPLCCAARLKCSSSIVQLLIDFGASLESQDMFGHTPAQIGRQPQPFEVQPSSISDFPFTWAALSFDQPVHSQIVFGCRSVPAEPDEAWKRKVAAALETPTKPNEAWKRAVPAVWEMPVDANEAWKSEVCAVQEM